MPQSPVDGSKGLNNTEKPELLEDLYFKYYMHQWEQVRHCENMRASVTTQLLAAAGGATAAFLGTKGCSGVQLAVSVLIVAIGVLGYFTTRSLANASRLHILRAREARTRVLPIHFISQDLRGFFGLGRHFVALNALVAVFGVALVAVALHQVPENRPERLLQCAVAK